MSKMNDLRIHKIGTVLNNYVAFGEDFLSAEECVQIIDEILCAEDEEQLNDIDECEDDELDEDEIDPRFNDDIPDFLLKPTTDFPPADEEENNKQIDVV